MYAKTWITKNITFEKSIFPIALPLSKFFYQKFATNWINACHSLCPANLIECFQFRYWWCLLTLAWNWVLSESAWPPKRLDRTCCGDNCSISKCFTWKLTEVFHKTLATAIKTTLLISLKWASSVPQNKKAKTQNLHRNELKKSLKN